MGFFLVVCNCSNYSNFYLQFQNLFLQLQEMLRIQLRITSDSYCGVADMLEEVPIYIYTGGKREILSR